MKPADLLAELIRGVTGSESPIRIRAWDGSEAGPADALAQGTAPIALGTR